MTYFADLGEYADHLRVEGNPWAEEIRDNFDHVATCEIEGILIDLRRMHPDSPKIGHYGIKLDDKPELDPQAIIEWLTDQLALLTEFKEAIRQYGYDHGDEMNWLKYRLSELETVKETVTDSGHWTEGNFCDAVQKLCESASRPVT